MDNVKVGLYIKQRIKEKGITQEQLAEEMNISSSAVSQVLSGKKHVRCHEPSGIK